MDESAACSSHRMTVEGYGFASVGASAAAVAADGLCGLQLAASADIAVAGCRCGSAVVPADASDAGSSCCG